MEHIKKNFKLAVALSAAQAAGFQRANVYFKDATQKDRDEFVKDFKSKLMSFEEMYSTKITEKDHINNIIKFRDELSSKHKSTLSNGKMLIGVAQKVINVYLKYLWVFSYIPMPPHCPVDRIVLNKVGIDDINWTELDDIDVYRGIIDKIRSEADINKLSIAEWELQFWNEQSEIFQ